MCVCVKLIFLAILMLVLQYFAIDQSALYYSTVVVLFSSKITKIIRRNNTFVECDMIKSRE